MDNTVTQKDSNKRGDYTDLLKDIITTLIQTDKDIATLEYLSSAPAKKRTISTFEDAKVKMDYLISQL